MQGRLFSVFFGTVIICGIFHLQPASSFLGPRMTRRQSLVKVTTDSPILHVQASNDNVEISIDTIRPTITDRARTITHVCTSGTLCTTSAMSDSLGAPFGSYVDYILDDSGCPVLLLSDQSIHTQNIKISPTVSLFCQLPRSQLGQSAASLSRVTTMGNIEVISPKSEDFSAIKLAFTLIHPYSEQIVDSPKFTFYRIKPQKIYFSGGFGVLATWVDVDTYAKAKPDVLAQDVSNMLAKLNNEKQAELKLLAKHFLRLDLSTVNDIRIQTTDRLGIDVRVQTGEYTDEYRIGFRYNTSGSSGATIGATSSEEAKSEIMKLFQEAWERDNGGYDFTDTLPPVLKYAEDILRSK